jgi:hypothetical protein
MSQSSAARVLALARQMETGAKRTHDSTEEDSTSQSSDDSASDAYRSKKGPHTHAHKQHGKKHKAKPQDKHACADVHDPLNKILIGMSENPVIDTTMSDMSEAQLTDAVSGKVMSTCIICTIALCEKKLKTTFVRYNRVLSTAALSPKVDIDTIVTALLANIIVDIRSAYKADTYKLVVDGNGNSIDVRFPASDPRPLSKVITTHFTQHDMTAVGNNFRAHATMKKYQPLLSAWSTTSVPETAVIFKLLGSLAKWQQ